MWVVLFPQREYWFFEDRTMYYSLWYSNKVLSILDGRCHSPTPLWLERQCPKVSMVSGARQSWLLDPALLLAGWVTWGIVTSIPEAPFPHLQNRGAHWLYCTNTAKIPWAHAGKAPSTVPGTEQVLRKQWLVSVAWLLRWRKEKVSHISKITSQMCSLEPDTE